MRCATVDSWHVWMRCCYVLTSCWCVDASIYWGFGVLTCWFFSTCWAIYLLLRWRQDKRHNNHTPQHVIQYLRTNKQARTQTFECLSKCSGVQTLPNCVLGRVFQPSKSREFLPATHLHVRCNSPNPNPNATRNGKPQDTPTLLGILILTFSLSIFVPISSRLIIRCLWSRKKSPPLCFTL
jgi:hypothetical protein